MKHLCVFLLLLAAFALVACGDEIETSRSIDESGIGLLAVGESIDQLPCDASNEGKFVYVSDSSEIYYCMDGEWTIANGKDGTDGKDGKDGTDGTDGKDGSKCAAAGFGDGFTVLCGTEKATIALKNLMPDTCTITDETENGFKVTCGKDSVWQKAGKDAKDPVRCSIEDTGYGTAVFACGADSVVITRALCGGRPYDPENQFCYEDEPIDLCNGETYDVTKFFCHFGTLMKLCGGAPYDPAVRFCSDDLLYDMCGISTYDTEKEFCAEYRIFAKCPDKSYNTLTHFCDEDNMKLYSKCGGSAYDPATQFCSQSAVYDKCDGRTYKPEREFCEDGTVYNLCGRSKPYDTKVYFCYTGILYTLCGGKPYNPSTYFCLDGKTYSRCGTNSSYDPTEFTCRDEVLYGKCGGKEYQAKNQVCVGSAILDKCGEGGAYDAQKYFCVDGEMYPLCNGKTYDVKTDFCRDGTLHKKCGGEEFDPDEFFCSDGTLVHKCGGKEYDTGKYFCVDGKLMDMCGGTPYNPSEAFCYNKVVYPFCGGKEYDPKKQFCLDKTIYDLCAGHVYTPMKNGKCVDGAYYYDVGSAHYFVDFRDDRVYSYVTVKGIKWMVDYLKIEYPAKGSTRCPLEQEAHCNSNGRQYTWAAAVDSLGIYSAAGIGQGYGATCKWGSSDKIRGICPEGWRLPRYVDLPSDADIRNSPEAQALSLDGPGHSSAISSTDYCIYACSISWLSVCTNPTYGAYAAENLRSNTVHFSSSSRLKHLRFGIRCVKD